MINQKVTNAQKSTGGHKGTAARRKQNDMVDKLDEDLNKLDKCKKTLDATRSANLSEITGDGFVSQRKRNAYELLKGGSFDNLFFDPAKLQNE